MNISVQVDGVEAVREWFRNRAINLMNGPRVIEVYTRNARRNAVIAGVQAHHDRNPFFTTARERRQILEDMRAGLTAGLRSGRGEELDRQLDGTAHLLATSFRYHIDRRQSGGPPPLPPAVTPHATRALTPDYAKAKRRRFGRALPELVATGEFRASIAGRVVRG